jgi:hypothetical protein
MALHFGDSAAYASEERPGDDGVADVQFVQMGQGEDGPDVIVIDTMAGIDNQSEVLS